MENQYVSWRGALALLAIIITWPLAAHASLPDHIIHPPVERDGQWWLPSPTQALEAEITTTGLQLHSRGPIQADVVSMTPLSLGRQTQRPLAAGTVHARDDAVHLVRPGGFTEIFRSSHHGIRQDFRIQQRPAGNGPLTLMLAVQGAEASGEGQGVRLRTASGRELVYDQLHITDAAGQILSGRMQALDHGQLQLTVDDRDAQYPILIDPTFSDANWQVFGPATVGSPNNNVRAMVEYQGDLYVGGTFADIGATRVFYVARWDGYQWHALDAGVNNAVYSLAVYDNKLIVGGSFTSASGVETARIASWDGNQWQALGSGMNSTVVDMLEYNGELIVAGIFTAAGSQSVQRIARWDGTEWHAMGGPDHGTINTLAVYDGDLMIGGSFYLLDGNNLNYVARWNGSTWSGLGDGMNTSVNDLAEFQGKLYATGQFTSAGGTAANYIASWDGSHWSPVGSGLSDAGFSLYSDTAVLYAGGQFETAGGVSSLGIAAWDGSTWSTVGDGLELYSGSVIRLYRMITFNNELVLGGLFSKGADNNLIRLNSDDEWTNFTSQFVDGRIDITHQHNGELIVGGSFGRIGGIEANNIARWDGTQWHAIGDGFDNSVHALASHGGELYAGGSFTQSGGDLITGVARWDSTAGQWVSLDGGVDNAVYSLKEINGALGVIGAFSQAGGHTSRLLALWDGTQWQPYGLPYTGQARDVTFYNDTLVVAGSFHNMATLDPINVASFDGAQWQPLGGHFAGQVNSLTHYDGKLIMAGDFSEVAGIAAHNVAAWDGHTWSEFAAGLPSPAGDIQAFKEQLFLAADSGLYLLENDTWQAPAAGISSLVSNLSIVDDSLYLAGEFSAAGGKATQNLARLVPDLSLSLDEQGGAGPVVIKYFRDSTVTLPQPEREGFIFTGWNTASDGSGVTHTSSLALGSVDISLYAQWQPDTYTLSFDSAGGSSVADISLAPGEAVVAPTAPTREGYTFTGWSPALPATMPDGNLTVTAQWQVNSYTVSFDTDGGSAIAPLTVEYRAAVTAPAAPTRTGHTFTGWSPALPATMPANNVAVTAQWQVNSYTLSFDSAGGSPVAPMTLDFGTAIVAPAAPTRVNHTFQGWLPALPATMPAQALTVTAQWQELPKYTATASVSGNGQISPASQTVYIGDTVSFTLTLDEPSDYVALSGTCQASRSGSLITTAALNADCSLVVHVHPSTEVEKAHDGPLASHESVTFRLLGGAGEKTLAWAHLLRADIQSVLTEDEASALVTRQDDGDYLFASPRTGRYTLGFNDETSGEITEVSVDVLPYLALGADHQLAASGSMATLGLWLSDEPIHYPVTATLVGEQMGFLEQTVTLTAADALRQSLDVATLNVAQAGVSLRDIDQALAGTPASQTLSLSVEPLPLAVRLLASQGTVTDTRVIGRDAGPVLLQAQVQGAAADSFTWSLAGSTLSGTGDQLNLDPQTLSAGTYQVAVDAVRGMQQGSTLLTLQVVEQCTAAGCDLPQGVPDSDNPFAGQPHRLSICPAVVAGNRVTRCEGQPADASRIEVSNLYRLTPGQHSLARSWETAQFGAAVGDAVLPPDAFHLRQSPVVDFQVQDLTNPGDTVSIALTLPGDTGIPAQAVWRKFIDGQWQDFVETGLDRIESAPKNAHGQCPAVSADAWQAGLTQGDGCIRLRIQDGGPNDADGQANGIVTDPGALATPTARALRWNSGGAAGGLPWVLLGLAMLWRRHHTRPMALHG